MGISLQESKNKENSALGFNGQSAMDILQKIKEPATKNRRELAAFYRDLARKRSPEYMNNLGRLSELMLRRNELVKKKDEFLSYGRTNEEKTEKECVAFSVIDGNSQEDNQRANVLDGDHKTANDIQASNIDVTKADNDVSQVNCTETVSEIIDECDSSDEVISDQENIASDSIDDELKELDKEIENIGNALEDELPKASKLLTIIFWDMYQEILTQRGIIGEGSYAPYDDADELIRRCGAENEEQARRQLRKGDASIREEGTACMAAEIYLDAICIIYPDGSTRVIRD